ncbi:TM2 domain-containing protein [Candidatus Synechococcus calcipolaris G9]|uniref:TM2 domain-containing protein n=1 Tax=Candidatus Synechococcus calcipolaris G9 TaxID=1497997 RepID=A0ABT6F1E8_9SYNE|nr:TM2 domain-containing protein [Candidatus Synechococcus calcipolaris]MDG2991640.1 TM2 domain-containing protein [Candidatus Synechococcus calcipolaris G9]
MPRSDTGVAYLLWCLGFFGLCGVQRLYTGNIVMGLIYLFTFGFCFIGQLIDLLLIPDLVHQRNLYFQGRYGISPLPQGHGMPIQIELEKLKAEYQATNTPMQRLLVAAQKNGGVLSAAQAAMYTQLEPDQLQAVLMEAQRVGYATISNDATTGAIRYHFDL